ncbi:hypothetical protein M231_00531 [Tremella mesenterica]|uniref:Uncharacterized protein n=1 Tax=Tremella mesenterica TaxID=5217 RepID=A0A4Q1BVK5_TREME|nr:hypothetical protein M231_00531 [Tremella mesenterica]
MSQASSSSLPSTTILVLHAHPDPLPFLSRLTSASIICPDVALNEEKTCLPWKIDNKYYTANVNLSVVPVGSASSVGNTEGIQVIIFLFENLPDKLPPELSKLMRVPRDIALAIRLSTTSKGTSVGKSVAQEDIGTKLGEAQELTSAEEEERWEAVEEMFDQLGMELLDETRVDEDDERPIPIHERVRETLMTHMWPNMSMKPRPRPNFNPSVSSLHPSSSSSSSQPLNAPQPAKSQYPIMEDDQDDDTFPTKFNPPLRVPTHQPSLPLSPGSAEFPDISELKAALGFSHNTKDHIPSAARYSPGAFGGDVLDAPGYVPDKGGEKPLVLVQPEGMRLSFDLDEDEDEDEDLEVVGPGEEEYARLEDWLEEDDDMFGPVPAVQRQEDWLDMDDRVFSPIIASIGLPKDLSSPHRSELYDHPSLVNNQSRNVENDDQNIARVKHVSQENLPSVPKPDLKQDLSKEQPSVSQSPPKFNSQLPQPPKPQENQQESPIDAQGFEDDFANFISAPPAREIPLQIPLDPTSLLTHLQTVRAELSILGEGERRERAAKEVVRVMRGMGVDMGELGELEELLDLDEDEVGFEEMNDFDDWDNGNLNNDDLNGLDEIRMSGGMKDLGPGEGNLEEERIQSDHIRVASGRDEIDRENGLKRFENDAVDEIEGKLKRLEALENALG